MTKKGPVCTVVCITYNHARFARAALTSIFKQTFRDIEIVVIDDGSTDDTASVVEEVSCDSPFPFQFITRENTGNVPLNLNRALSRARGEFVAFLSLDDMLHSKAIESRMAEIENPSSMAFVADTRLDEIDGTGETTGANVPTAIHGKAVFTGADLLELEYQSMGSFYIQCAVFNRRVIASIGGFDDDMTGDDIVLRTKLFRHLAANPDLEFRLIETAGFLYRKHGNNLHQQTARQIRTIIQWRDRFFTNRPLPDEGIAWIQHWLNGAVAEGRLAEIAELRSMAPEIEDAIKQLPSAWKLRRRRIRATLKRLLGRKV